MTDTLSQFPALDCYEKALIHFRAGHFAKAQQKIREYKRIVDYGTFCYVDNRTLGSARATVIIITRDRGKDLLACLESLKNQEASSFEVIVVNNGGKLPLRDVLKNEKIILVQCPIPFTPSEGRNIGVFYARTDLLIFLDDDALAEPGFVKSAIQAFEEHPFLGLRGRILPKSSSADHSLAGVYDLGNYPLPALLDTEGNMAVPRTLYRAVEGMNPLLFGAEGLELTARLLLKQPDGDVFYWPEMVIRHDYASGDMLLAKRKRQALVNEYFRVMNGRVLDIKKRYAEIYRMSRKEEQGAFLKTVPAKIRTICRDMSLALKSEKSLPIYTALPAYEKNMSKPSGNRNPQELSQKEAETLLQQVHALEMELETTRKSLAFRLGHLIRDVLSAPLRNGLLFPIRLGRLIKEYNDRSGNADLN